MKWLDRWRARRPSLDALQAEALARYRAAPRMEPAARIMAQRIVVVDVESTGLDPYRDRLVSIGAVAIRDGLIRCDDGFSVILRQDQASGAANILVHGISTAAQLAGREPAAGLVDFLAYTGGALLVGFHADFDRVLIERAVRVALGIAPHNSWLDLARLGPALRPSHGGLRELDEWLAAYGIENFARHDALADALATAQLAQALIAEAARTGPVTLGRLAGLDRAQRWLGRAPRL